MIDQPAQPGIETTADRIAGSNMPASLLVLPHPANENAADRERAWYGDHTMRIDGAPGLRDAWTVTVKFQAIGDLSEGPGALERDIGRRLRSIAARRAPAA